MEKQRVEREKQDLYLHVERLKIADFRTANGAKNVKLQDIFLLSHETEDTIPKEKPTLETFERLVEKHGKRKKKNG